MLGIFLPNSTRSPSVCSEQIYWPLISVASFDDIDRQVDKQCIFLAAIPLTRMTSKIKFGKGILLLLYSVCLIRLKKQEDL